MKQYLEKRGFYSDVSPATATQLFIEHGNYYLSGLVSIAFLSTLADEILYANLQKGNTLSPLLFTALKCASDPPSPRKKLIAWHRKLKGYLETLSHEKENTETLYA